MENVHIVTKLGGWVPTIRQQGQMSMSFVNRVK